MSYLLEERVALLRDIENSAEAIDDFGLLNACIHCLKSNELTSLLRQEAERSSKLRNGLIKKVTQDLRASPSLEHIKLVEYLITRLEKTDARGRQGIGYCLSMLLPDLPAHVQHNVQITLLRSRFVGLRRRGYKAVAADSTPQVDFLMESWTAFQDFECAWLLTKLLTPQELITMRREILHHLHEGWQISRLYLRVAEADPTLLKELKQIDGISYSYVLAKLGHSLSTREAKYLIAKHETDERLGLLIWSIGQMQIWDVLAWFKNRLSKIELRRHNDLIARLGLN